MASEYIPSLPLVQQTAWEVLMLLVQQANFSSEGGNIVALTDIRFSNEEHGYELLRYVLDRISGFYLEIIDSPGTDEESGEYMPFFQRVRYRHEPQRIEARFNELAVAELQQLQYGIILLQEQNKLTKANLTRLMRKRAPRITYHITIKQLPSIHASPTLLVTKLAS